MLRLVGGNLNYSSWTIRAWMCLKHAGVEFKFHDVGLFTKPNWKDRILAFSGAGKVPILVDGASSIHESLAIAETIAERHPEAGLWPVDAALRARGRAISQEMASGFVQLRTHFPCNLRGRSAKTPSSPEIQSEIDRVMDIFDASLSTSTGKFLLGDFSIADAMYFPVLARFRTFGVPLSELAEKYSEHMFSLPIVQELEEIASSSEAIQEYDAVLEA